MIIKLEYDDFCQRMLKFIPYIRQTLDELEMDTLDLWLGWPEILYRAGLCELYWHEQPTQSLDNPIPCSAFEVRLKPEYAHESGYEKYVLPISICCLNWMQKLDSSYSFLPKKFMPPEWPVQFTDYGMQTQTIMTMSGNRRLSKRRSVAKRYLNNPQYRILRYGQHDVEKLLTMFQAWKVNKQSRNEGGYIEDLVYSFYAKNQQLVSIPDTPEGIIVEDLVKGCYVGWTLAIPLTEHRWTSLIRIVADPREYAGLADFLYQQVAQLFTEYPEESDGMAGFGDAAGCKFFKSSYATESCMRYYVKPT